MKLLAQSDVSNRLGFIFLSLDDRSTARFENIMYK